MATCIIQSCPYWKLGRPRQPDITLHAFPRTARRIKSWLKQTGHKFKDIDAFIGRILETRNDRDYQLCSAHFTKDSYTILGGAKVLKANAMPTIFPVGSRLIREACLLRTARKTRLASRRNAVKPSKPGSTNNRATPVPTKTDMAVQTECSPSTEHCGVQTEELFSHSNKTQDRSLMLQLVTLPNDENCQSQDMAQNVTSAAPRHDKSRRHVTERILNLTLEIIYLLTGERPDLGGGDKNKNLTIKSTMPFLTVERNNGQKILEVTQKIIELLTGKVPIRCQDVTVYFSMEEWEYLEGHKDAMMQDQLPLTSQDSLVENSTNSPNPLPACIDNDIGPHFSKSPCRKNPCIKEEIVSDEEHFPNPEISTAKCHQQMPSAYVKKELDLTEQRGPKSKISAATHCRQPYIKGHLSVKDRLPESNIFPPAQPTLPEIIDIKEGPLSDEEHLLNSRISTPIHHTRPTTLHAKEETLPDKEHLRKSKISSPPHHGQSQASVIKGSLSDEEHLLNPTISTPIHHTQPTTLHIKEERLSNNRHLRNTKISPTTHHTQPRAIRANKGSLSDDEHLLNPTISTPIHQREAATIHIKEEPLPDKEHLLNPKISSPTPHRPHRTIHTKEESLSEEELLSSDMSPPIHHTEPTTIHIKEEPILDEEHLPDEMDYTTIIINEDSMSSDEDCPPHSSTSLTPGHCTFSQARKRPTSNEEEPSSPIQYIPVQINDDFLERQKHLQQSYIPTHSTEVLVDEVPHYVDKSAPKCDEDLSIIPVKLLPAEAQRAFLSDEERSLFCPECGKSFTDRARVEAHLRSHWGEKPFSCPLCLKGFRSKSKLIIHQMMHSGEKPYACSECGKCFAQNAYLQRHIKGHTGEKPFPCSICGKCFACRSDMIKHEFTHTGARPHPCTLCGKRFTKKSHLNRHMRIHTGEKPFCCPDCGRSFSCNSDMVSHQRIHQGVKPFSCSQCGKSFLRKQDAQRHQTVHRLQVKQLQI